MSDDTPATTVAIIHTFMAIPHQHRVAHNWGTAPDEFRYEWHVNDETYINGVVLTVDGDYWMGYLLECVDRTSGVLTFIVINLYHGPKADGTYDHDFMTYEPQCGTFGDRTDAADYVNVGTWAVSRCYGMIESWEATR